MFIAINNKSDKNRIKIIRKKVITNTENFIERQVTRVVEKLQRSLLLDFCVPLTV